MNARRIAFEMLKEIRMQGKYSNLLLRQQLDKADAKDKGFITQIVYGTLQNYRYVRINWIDLVEHIPNEELAQLIDMSVYQMLFLDKIPSYAILNEAVEITKKKINPTYAGMVNAVLHKVEKRGLIKVVGDEVKQLAITTSHPDWIIAMWKAQYGWEAAQKIARSNLLTKPNAVRVNTMRTSSEELIAQDANFKKGKLAKNALWYEGKDLIHSTYYQEGLLSIQDESSQMVVQLLDPQRGEHILDVCSAPGTKSCAMAECMQDNGSIVCGDIHEHRVKLIEEGAQRLHLHSLQAQLMDATKLEEIGDTCFDRVLCDVPCSGYGVLARKSDIKYHMQSNDMDTLIPLQQNILETASKHVSSQGILVYSTCTLNKKENEKQIDKFLANHEEFTLLSTQTIFPYQYDSDGFYMAKLQRK